METIRFDELPEEIKDGVRGYLDPRSYVRMLRTSLSNREAERDLYWKIAIQRHFDVSGFVPDVSWKQTYMDVFEFLFPTNALPKDVVNDLRRKDFPEHRYLFVGEFFCPYFSNKVLYETLPCHHPLRLISVYAMNFPFPTLVESIRSKRFRLRSADTEMVLMAGKVSYPVVKRMYRSFVCLRDGKLHGPDAFDAKLYQIWRQHWRTFSWYQHKPDIFVGRLNRETDEELARIRSYVLGTVEHGYYKREMLDEVDAYLEVPHQREKVVAFRKRLAEEAEDELLSIENSRGSEYQELLEMVQGGGPTFVVKNRLRRLPVNESFMRIFNVLKEQGEVDDLPSFLR